MKSKPVMVAEIVDDIRRIFQVLTEQSRKVECETSLIGSQLWVMKLLDEASPMRVSDLARRTYLHPATMVGLLDRLEAKELVRRTRSEEDRRVVHVDLTAQGREAVKNSPEVVQDLLVNGLEAHTDLTLKKISEGLGEIVAILGAKDVPPQLFMSSLLNLPKRAARGKK